MPFFGVELLAGLIPDLIYSTWAVALRKATTSSDNEPNMKSTSAIDVLGNSSPLESILSCMEMTLITFTLQNSRNIANSRTPRSALLNFEMTSSSPRSRQSMSCFHSGRVFSWLALSSMIRQQPYFSIQARSKVNVSYCSELNM